MAIQLVCGTILGRPGRSCFANRLEARNGLFGLDRFWGVSVATENKKCSLRLSCLVVVVVVVVKETA